MLLPAVSPRPRPSISTNLSMPLVRSSQSTREKAGHPASPFVSPTSHSLLTGSLTRLVLHQRSLRAVEVPTSGAFEELFRLRLFPRGLERKPTVIP